VNNPVTDEHEALEILINDDGRIGIGTDKALKGVINNMNCKK